MSSISAIVRHAGNGIYVNADGLRVNRDGTPYTPNFAIVVMGDLHSGYASSGYRNSIDYPAAGWDTGRNRLTASITEIISKKDELNIIAFMACGDVINGGNTPFSLTDNWVFVTGQLQRLVDVGIPVIACAGNHEGTYVGTDANWERYMTPILRGTKAFIEADSGNHRQAAWKVTYDNTRIVIVTADFYATNRTAWVKQKLDQYPDHLGIVVTHSDLASHCNRIITSDDKTVGVTDFPGLDYTILNKIPNLVQIHSGHQRDAFNWHNMTEVMNSGAVVTHCYMNTQQSLHCGLQYVRYYRFYPEANGVIARTYDSSNARYLDNGDAEEANSGTKNGFNANYGFPLYAKASKQQFVRMQGITAAQQGSGSGPGIWDSSLSANELFDTAMVWSKFNASTMNFDGFALGRFFAQNKLDLVRFTTAMYDDFHSGTKLFSFDQNGLFTCKSLVVENGYPVDGGGLKHKRVSTGSINGAATALVTITWTTAFPDANYTVQSSVVDSTNSSLSLSIVHIETITASAVTVRVINNAVGALTGIVHAIAIHD